MLLGVWGGMTEGACMCLHGGGVEDVCAPRALSMKASRVPHCGGQVEGMKNERIVASAIYYFR